MLFNDQGSTTPPTLFAISQPAHALISGRILAAWSAPLHPDTVLAAEQHDMAWIDWEVSPSFDPATGRPHFFRHIGASLHAPMWDKGVERASAAWGRHVALLLSRHGSTIYERFSDRHRSVGTEARTEDDRAAQDYLARHRPLQDSWRRALGLEADDVAREADLLACVDTLSLILCGALPAPSGLAVAGRTLTLAAVPGTSVTYSLDPWPLAVDEIVFETEARALPSSGRFSDEAGMRAWLANPARVTMSSSLRRQA